VPDLDDEVIIETPIDSPLTGIPVAYPAEVGAVADRVFIGDQEGALWRLDLSEPDPDDWTFTLFYDAFPSTSPSGDLSYQPEQGQPIATRPIVSVDGENRLVVLFSTGDQESIFSSDVDNFIVSLTEVVEQANDGSESFVSKVNWYKRLEKGKRVTGPMVLFSSQLYAATFAGADANEAVCAGGSSTVWAMHYLNRAVESDPSSGGAPLWDLDSTSKGPDAQERTVRDSNNQETIVFGLTLAQEPSCATTSLEEDIADVFLGYGAHTAISNLKPGKFQLIMHTGGLKSSDSAADAAANQQSITLETPSNITRIDSWAAIVE